MISMLAAFRVGAFSTDCGRPQNGTASTGKLNYSNVRCGEASNRKFALELANLPGRGVRGQVKQRVMLLE